MKDYLDNLDALNEFMNMLQQTKPVLNLEDIVIRKGICINEEYTNSVLSQDAAVAKLWARTKKKGSKYKQVVKEYIDIYAVYSHYKKPRELITDLEKILRGIMVVQALPKDFLTQAVRIRDSKEYNGSWDKLIEDLDKKRQERQLYKIIRKKAAEEENAKILEFKKIEEKYEINLADFCLAL